MWLNKHFAEGQKAPRKGAYEGRELREDAGRKPFIKLRENTVQIFLSLEKLMTEGNMIALGQISSLQNVFRDIKVTPTVARKLVMEAGMGVLDTEHHSAPAFTPVEMLFTHFLYCHFSLGRAPLHQLS